MCSGKLNLSFNFDDQKFKQMKRRILKMSQQFANRYAQHMTCDADGHEYYNKYYEHALRHYQNKGNDKIETGEIFMDELSYLNDNYSTSDSTNRKK